MTPDEFRKHGHAVVDWMADYMKNIRDYPVMTPQRPGDLASSLPATAPDDGEPMEDILEGFRRQIVPAVTHWNHPGFHAYFSVSGAPPGILAEMLIATLNVNGMLWKSCPAATELELVTLAWLRDWLGLPEEFFGVIYDTASTSTLHAIAAARDKARSEGGMRVDQLTVYCSDQAHSSVDKGAMTAGLERVSIRRIASGDAGAMRTDALEEAIHRDLAVGLHPCCIVATIGTTPTAAIDPVAEIASIAERRRIWLHVDGAYGGVAAIVDARSDLRDGLDRADSFVLNPHKWLLTPIDLSVFYTRRPDWLRRAFSLTPSYLETAEAGQATNLMDYGMQLGRRFRSLKLWFTMRYYGRLQLAGFIERHCAMAQKLASWVEADPRFELCAPVLLSLVCFRRQGSDADNQQLMDRVNASGVAFLGGTNYRGRLVIRFAIGNYHTTEADLERVWQTIRSLA